MRRALSALIAAVLTLNLNMAAIAQSAPVDLDLASTARSAAPALLGGGSVPIVTGSGSQQVNGASLLTPAEQLAVWQVISTGSQSIKLGGSGTAVGGSFNLNPSFSSGFSNLVIPKGVTSLSTATNLNILGDLTNSGRLHVNTAFNVPATISANNIVNNLGALITSTSTLNLLAANSIINYGKISGADNLSFTAGNSIINSGPAAVINAASSLNLLANNIVNSGAMTATNGNINISSLIASNILFNNTNGTLSALNGDINVRDALFTGKYHFNMFGGDVLSSTLNIWSGNGNADLSVNNITSLINVTAGNVHILADTANLQLGAITFNEDPTFFNTGGSITVNSAISAASNNIIPGVAIVASGDVLSTAGGSINTNDTGSTNGFPVIVIAGANFTVSPSSAQSSANTGTQGTPPGNGDTTSVLTLLGPSSTGGKIDLSNLTTFSTAGSGSTGRGGSVTLAAFSGTAASSGTVNVGNIATNSDIKTLNNGNITIIAGAKSDPAGGTAITTGNLTTDTQGAPSGGVMLITGNPVITGGQFQIQNGAVIGLNSQIASASLGAASINPGASITTGAITTNTAPVVIVAGSNVTLNGNITTKGVSAGSVATLPTASTIPPGPGGDVTVVAGGNINGSIVNISTIGSTGDNATTPSNAGGDVRLIAGANTSINVTHTFTGSGLGQTPSVNSDTLQTSLTVSGASSTGGNINLTALENIDTTAGPTQVLAPVNNVATGGDVTMVAFAGAQSPTTSGLIVAQASNPGAIVTGGSPINNVGGITGDTSAVTNPNEIINVSSTASLVVGAVITGPGIPSGTTITAKTANTITMSANATATATSVALVGGTPQSATNNANGDVTIIAGGQPGVGTNSITLGTMTDAFNINTTGGNEGGGNITIQTGAPTAGLPFFYGYNSVTALPASRSGSFSATTQTVPADITILGNLTAVGGSFQVNSNTTLTTDITVRAGGNLTIGAVSNTNNTLPVGGPAGALASSTITLVAGSAMNLNGAITSLAGAASPGVSGADGGTINLSAASFVFPSGQQLISADGTGGYAQITSPLNFNGMLANSSTSVTDVFTTIDGVGLVIGTSLIDNAGNTLIVAGTTIAGIPTQSTQANATLMAASNVVSDIITVGLTTGTAVAGGSLPAGTTIDTVTASVSFTGDTDPNTNVITNVSSVAGLSEGQIIAGPGIPIGATIAAGGIGANTITFDGGNATSANTTATIYQAGQITLQTTAAGGFANVVPGPIVLSAANGIITLNQATSPTATGVQPLTSLLPLGQSGGNGGTITITTTSASPLVVGTSNFQISAKGAATGGNGGTLNLTSGSSMSLDPTQITVQPFLNNLANAGFGTLITTGAGATFNLKAATTLFVSSTLDASGAPSTLAAGTGTPGGNGGAINIDVSSSQTFNIGGAIAGPTANGLPIGGILSANSNGGTTPGFGSGGSLNIINRGTGGITAASGSLQVQAAAATDTTNLGAAQQTYLGGNGGQIILTGQTVLSSGNLSANGGDRSAVRGSGDGGLIQIVTNSSNALTIDPTASGALNGVIGTLDARGNTGSIAPGQGTVLTTLPTGNGGTLILKNTGGGIVIGATAGMSVAAADASSNLGTIGGNGGTIELNASTTINSAIGLSVNGGLELAPAAYSGPATVSDGFDVQITLSSGTTAGLFVGQTVTLQDSSGAAEAVLIKSLDSASQFTVWQVVAAPVGGYSNGTLQAYFSSGNGGKINITTNSTTQLAINPTTATANSIGDPLTANGFNGGSVFVTNRGSGGVSVAAASITTTAIAPAGTVGTTLVGVSGFGGNISIQAPTGRVAINGPLSVNGATTAVGQTVGANFGGIGGNLTIVSNSTTQFEVGAAAGTLNGVVGTLSANGGSGIGGQNNAGTITIVNLGTGGIEVFAPANVSAISIIPGVKSDGITFGTNGPPGNGGSLTLTAPKGPVFFAGTNGIDMSGNTQHAPNQADGLGGSLSITSNSTTAFNIGNGTTNGTAGPISANGWSGGSISITNLGTGGIILDNTGAAPLTVTANPASQTALGSGGIHVFGGPGGTIALLAPKGPVGITGNLDASGGAQFVDIGSSVFLQGGDGGQISILTGVAANNFTIGATAGDKNGISGTLSANGANGGIVNVSAVNGADISVTSSASISVAGYPGINCTMCNNDIPLGNPPTDYYIPGGNGGKIYLQAPTTGGTVFISGTATTGGLSVAGASASANGNPAGPHNGNGGTIVIVSNSTVSLNIGAATTNGLGSGGSIFDASGYNGGTIAIENLSGNLYFNPNLISVSSAAGSVAADTDLPGGNGGTIDLQAPKGKLGATATGTLNANATASTAGSPQLTASGGIITLNAAQIDETLATLTLSAIGANAAAYLGKGGTVIISQSISTAAQALPVGQASPLRISVAGSPGANLGGTITLSSPAGITVSGSLASDTGSSGTINLLAAGKNSIIQNSGTIKTGSLNITVGDLGDGPGTGVNTTADSLTLVGSGAFAVNNTGSLLVTSAFMHKSASLNISVNQGNLTVNTLSSTGAVTLSATGAESVADSGNITITGSVIAGTANLTAASGDGSTGGGIVGTTSGLVSAKSITLSPEMGGVNLNTSTGLLTIHNNISSNAIVVNNTGNLFLSLGTSSSINSLVINNVGSITTVGAISGAAAVTLDNVPGTTISGSITAGSNVLNTTEINSLIIGAPLQGVGLPAGTTVGTIGDSVYFTGETAAGSNIINSLTVNGGTGTIAPGASVVSTALPADTTITSVIPQFGLPGETTSGSTIVNNVPPANAQAGVLPGVTITGAGIPAGTTIAAPQTQQFGFQGSTSGVDAFISDVPDTTQGLVVGAAVIGQTGIPSNTTILTIGPSVGGFVQLTMNNTITQMYTNVTFTVPPYIEISQAATSTAANTYTVPSYALVSAQATSAGAADFNQSSYVTLSNAATATVSGASLQQLSSAVSGNSSSIRLGATVGQGATNNASAVTINAGGSIVQNAGLITANSVLLTSQNGNIGLLTRTFTNNIYTPAGTPINVDIVPGAGSTPGSLAVLTTNTIDNSSPGTVNVSIANSTANPTGGANLQFIQAGGDVLLAANLGSSGILTVANPVTSTFGAITLLNSNTSDGAITVNSNMIAGGGPLTIQNNNNSAAGATITLSSTAASPITLSGVGWLVNGLGAANMANSASTSGTAPAIPGLQSGVALITGAFPAPPLTSDGNPGFITANTTTTGTLATTVTFGATGSVTGTAPNTVVNATGASVAFQGAAGAIELGDSAIINAPSSALVITSLDLTDLNVVSNLTALSVAGSGITVSGNTFTFDPTQATIPFTLANLAELNVKTGATINLNNFTASNPVAVNIVAPNKNVLVTGTLAFGNSVANTLDSDGRLFFNSTVVGQVLTVAGTISSNNNVTINAGGSVTVSTAINAGANGSLGLFTGAANLFDTTPAATDAPAGTLTLSSAALSAGQSNGSIFVNAASIVSTSTSTVGASNVTLAVGGTNWAVNPTTNAPIQIASSQITGIPTITASTLLLNAASGASIKLTGAANFNVGNLSLNVNDTSVTISQSPSIAIAAQGLAFTGTITAGNSVLSTNNSSLVAGTLVRGIGLPAGTVISSVNSTVDFTGSIGANGNVVNNVPDTVPLVIGAEVSGVGLPAGTTISEISPSVGGVVQVTLLLPGNSVSTTPVNPTATFAQAPYAQLSNPAELSLAAGNFQDFVSPGTLHKLNLTSTTGGISTSANISCSSCTFKTSTLTNLNTISTNSPVGTITISPPTGSALSIVQTDGVNSGSIVANAGVSITAALALTISGGTISTAQGQLLASQTGTGNLTVSGASMSAGTFNGIPLGPNILPTDVASAGNIMVQELGTGSLVINDSATFNSIAGNVAIMSTSGTVTLQGIFQADGGNVVIMNSGTSLTATNSVFNANALGTTATNSVGGIVEIGAGTNISQLNNLSTVPGTVPVTPLFNQPDGPPMPLGSNVAIDNNASGSSVYPTGAIMQNISGTGVINVGNSATSQTSLNLLGGGIVFDASSASVLIDGSIFQTNGYTPLSAKSAGNSLCIEMEDSEGADKQALAHVFTPGQSGTLMLTNHGFVNAGKHASLASASSAQYTFHSGSMFVEALSQTTIHTDFADIKAKKGAMLALSHEPVGLRIAACSGPGQTTVHVGGHAISLSAGEEIIISNKELTAEQRSKSDGIGRRNYKGVNIMPHLWVSTCEVSILGVLNHWKQCAIKDGNDAVARALSGKMLKTAAALMVVTQSRGVYEARPYKAEPTAPHFTPVRYRQTQSQSQAARNRLRASAEF